VLLGLRKFRDGYRKRGEPSWWDRAARINWHCVRGAHGGAAITQSGVRHSMHRMLAFAVGQIVIKAWVKTGKGAG
jgi:hypothetical protein